MLTGICKHADRQYLLGFSSTLNFDCFVFVGDSIESHQILLESVFIRG